MYIEYLLQTLVREASYLLTTVTLKPSSIVVSMGIAR